MKCKIRQTGKTEKVIEVCISRELVAGELERIYREISKRASLPGFRVGKVPMELVKSKYKKDATDEAVRNLLSSSFKKAIEESDVDVLGLPEISDLEFNEEKGMSYKATVSLRPQPKLKAYKGLSLKKEKKEIKESDVDSQIDGLREMSAKFLVKEGCAVKGDYIVCDLECLVEGHPVEKEENIRLYVDENAFIPASNLEGLKVGDEKDVERSLPKDYSNKEIAGKQARFHLRVKEIKEKILPELNDEFASAVGNLRGMAELKEAIRESIKRNNEYRERHELEEQATRLLNKMATFDLPEYLVEKHLNTLVKESKERLKRERFSEEQINSMEKDLRERLREEATRQVRTYFILDEIANLENIDVEDEEIEKALGIIAASSSRSVDDIRHHYKEHDLIEDLREELKQKKVLDFVIKNANISVG